MESFLHDLRHAVRGLRHSLFFAGMTALTLALGIGVITALFAVVEAVLLAPLVFDQDRVVRAWKFDTQRGFERFPISYPEFRAWRDASRSFEAMAAIQYADASTVALSIDDAPTVVAMAPVSAGFFTVVHEGAPLHGRWIEPADEAPGRELVAVVSEPFWRRASGGDPAFVGRRLSWAGGGRTLLVVGVAPPALEYPLGTDVWVPIARYFDAATDPFGFDAENRRFAQFNLLGRLARGTSLDQARAELTVLQQRSVAQFPDDYRPARIVVEPLLNTVVGNSRQVLWFLFAAAGLVFAIAGVNVASLLLMRAAAKRREQAVRIALGATSARLVRQEMTEALLLGLVGAACALPVAEFFLRAVQWLAPGDMPRIERATIDVSVLAFCMSAGLIWVVTFGAAPSWLRQRLDSTAALGQDLAFRTVGGTTALRAFTIVEVASAVVAAIAAGLLVRSFVQLQGVDRGYESSNMAVVSVQLPAARYPDARSRVAFYEELLPKVAAIPGVISASPVHLGPGSGTTGLSAPMIFQGQTPAQAKANPYATFEPIMPSYFQTMGVAITRGRAFTTADNSGGAPAAIVSEAVARRYWPGEDPVGKQLKLIDSSPWTTVVGVAADTRYRELTRDWLTVYFAAPQFFFFSPGSLVVRTAQHPAGLAPAIRQTIRRQDRYVALDSIDTMDALAARELARPRAALTVATLFALMAVVLAAVGVYGVVSYDVSQRRREVAVRSALGATPARIFRAVVWRSAMAGGLGIALGLTVAAVGARSLRVLLFQVAPSDPYPFVGAAVALLGVVLLASYAPAKRAARTDPAVVLRGE
jgi:putative ABC transport system permease protein